MSKIILRQFVIVDDNNTEIRTKRTFEEVKKAYKRGNLFIEQCVTIKQKGFEFNHDEENIVVFLFSKIHFFVRCCFAFHPGEIHFFGSDRCALD